jgi:hypothetical protein
MKKIVLGLAVLVAAGIVNAQQNVPSGLTGLWRFQNGANYGAATFGNDITFNTAYGALMVGPWTDIGVDAWHTMYSDASIFQELSYNYMSVTHGIGANGGGDYVNQYTVAIDYYQGSLNGLWNGNYYNSLFQTSTGNANDGDLFIRGPSYAESVIGSGDTGYSTLTFDSSTWHRIVWSVDNSSFFRVYVDGTLYLDAAGQGIDGRYSLDPSFCLFADNDWEDSWGLVGTAATWDHALTSEEVAGMGGWIGAATAPTALIIPEPTTVSFLGLAGLLLLRKIRK